MAAAALVVLFNLLMDPYLFFGIPRIAGFNDRKPAVETRERPMKLFDIQRLSPRTLILGTSVADFGLDPGSPAWPMSARPVYNLSLAGGGPYTSYRYLQHTLAQRKLDLVVLTLDFEFFLTGIGSKPASDFEARLAATPDGNPNPIYDEQRGRDFVQAIFTLDALTASTATFTGNLLKVDSSDLVRGGNWSSRRTRVDTEHGAFSRIMWMDLAHMHSLRNKQLDPPAMSAVRAIVELCQLHGIRLILVIDPVHAGHLEIRRMLAQWEAFEEWKRQLATLAAEYPDAQGNPSIPLWDFSASEPYVTEPMPAQGHVMHWFVDRTHYTRALGNVIVEQLFVSQQPKSGVLLTPANVEENLTVVRESQARYRQRQPDDVQRLQTLFQRASNVAE